MDTKPREYRNNNASETVNINDVRKASKGFFVSVLGKVAFVDTTDKKDYGVSVVITDVPGEEYKHPHSLVQIVHSDNTVSDVGFLMRTDKTFNGVHHEWMWQEKWTHCEPGLASRQHFAPTLGAMLQFMQKKFCFTKAVW